MKTYFNKKTCSLWGTAFLLCMTGFTLTACGSDDDDEGGSGNVPSGPVVTYNGNLIIYNGESYFSYDEKGRCVQVFNEDEIWTIDYEKGILKQGYADEDWELPMQITFTKEGYIKKLVAEIQENVDGVNVKISGIINLEYDSNGHITSGSSNTTTTAKVGATTYTQYGKTSCKCTWEGDLMTRSFCDEEESEEGEKWTSYSTNAITYNNMENKYCQWSHAFGNSSFMDDYLGFVGLLGKAPSKFIKSYVEKETSTNNDGEPSTDVDTYDVSYELNNAGIINTEKIGYQFYQYQYNSQSIASTRSVANSQRHSPTALLFSAKELKKHIHDVAAKVKKQ